MTGLRIVILFGCFLWFLVNATILIQDFLLFDTVVYMEYQTPRRTMPPAITICTPCIYCGRDRDKPMYVDAAIGMFSDLVKQCRIYPSAAAAQRHTDCLPGALRSMQEGRKCFTFFSGVQGDQAPCLEFDRAPSIRLRVNGQHLQQSVGFDLALHAPDILPDMLSLSYHRLSAARVIQIHFVKLTELVAPAHCLQYDQGQFRSRGECFMYCMWANMADRRQACVNFYAVFSQHLFDMARRQTSGQRWQFCPANKRGHDAYRAARDRCLEQCRPACRTDAFWIDTSYSLEAPDNDTWLKIEWSTEPVVRLEHRAKHSPQTVLANVGGHAHVWLGISAAAVCRWFMATTGLRWPQPGQAIWPVRMPL